MKNFLPDITQIPIRSPFLKRKNHVLYQVKMHLKLITKTQNY